MKRPPPGLEIERRLEEDADRSYASALLALLNEERQRVDRCLSAGAPMEEYRRLQCLAEGLLAAVMHLRALAAQRAARTGCPCPIPPAESAGRFGGGPDAVYKLLIELGFSAAFRGLTERGARILAAGRVLRPSEVHALLGEAVIRLQKLELSEAATLLEEAIRREPQNKLVQAFGDLCFRLLEKLREGCGAGDRVVGSDTPNPLKRMGF